jgi:hypothetical protein
VVSQHADAFDLNLDDVTDLQWANPGRRASVYNIAWKQRHDLRDVPQQYIDGKDKQRGVGLLLDFTINPCLNAQALRR